MIVTIDGPAGAGKSSVSKRLAKRLGFQFLDTGAMYRAVTLMAMRLEIPLDDTARLSQLAAQLEINFKGEEVFVDGVDVTAAIREPEVTRNVGAIADNPHIRQHLVQLQRQIASQGRYVCEGRDQGTIAFPSAFCKIFLTASPEERAKRRANELRAAGSQVNESELLAEQNERDRRDASRVVGRLEKAEDAVEVPTDGLQFEDVVDQLERIVRSRLNAIEA